MANGFLRKAYELDTQQDTDAYYSAWATTYDDELIREGYRTPVRCAVALAQFVDLGAPILDVGCGTGLSGRAFAAAGFTNLTGCDVNEEMLAVARSAEVYRSLEVTDVADPFPFVPGTFTALAAVGVIGVGAAPLSLFAEAFDALAPGGCMVFSFNDHALRLPEFPAAIHDVIERGIAEQLFNEDGPHIEGLGIRSRVYVLRRTA